MNRTTKRKPRARREGAAMLIVLMVLLMTTATATFAIHSTSMEIRSAGFQRQAVQAEYLAEAGAYAAVSYVDVLKANGAIMQYLRTDVAASVATAPGEAAMDHATNVLRIRMEDFDSAPGVLAPPIETDAARVPSIGPRTPFVPTFMVDGTDVYHLSRDLAGTDRTGRGAQFFRMTLTSRANMAPAGDYQAAGDGRSYNDIAMRARAVTEMGPFFLGGH